MILICSYYYYNFFFSLSERCCYSLWACGRSPHGQHHQYEQRSTGIHGCSSRLAYWSAVHRKTTFYATPSLHSSCRRGRRERHMYVTQRHRFNLKDLGSWCTCCCSISESIGWISLSLSHACADRFPSQAKGLWEHSETTNHSSWWERCMMIDVTLFLLTTFVFFFFFKESSSSSVQLLYSCASQSPVRLHRTLVSRIPPLNWTRIRPAIQVSGKRSSKKKKKTKNIHTNSHQSSFYNLETLSCMTTFACCMRALVLRVLVGCVESTSNVMTCTVISPIQPLDFLFKSSVHNNKACSTNDHLHEKKKFPYTTISSFIRQQ